MTCAAWSSFTTGTDNKSGNSFQWHTGTRAVSCYLRFAASGRRWRVSVPEVSPFCRLRPGHFGLLRPIWKPASRNPRNANWKSCCLGPTRCCTRAIERRLSRISILPEPLDASAERVVEEAATEHGHEETFGVQRSLFSNRARATQILIVLNVFMFVVESCLGGGTDLDVLYRLGALFPPAVRAGEWWRLITAVFLHFGALHLAMNMFGLWFLGPFVEFALGFRRFMLVYLLAGIGSMATVMAFSSGANAESLTVGASGCVMGLVGATGSLMLRGWLREKALAAKRRLVLMLLIVSMQVLFDSVIPQVSMTAHLSGAFIGFAATMVLHDRLRPPAPQQPALKS